MVSRGFHRIYWSNRIPKHWSSELMYCHFNKGFLFNALKISKRYNAINKIRVITTQARYKPPLALLPKRTTERTNEKSILLRAVLQIFLLTDCKERNQKLNQECIRRNSLMCVLWVHQKKVGPSCSHNLWREMKFNVKINCSQRWLK